MLCQAVHYINFGLPVIRQHFDSVFLPNVWDGMYQCIWPTLFYSKTSCNLATGKDIASQDKTAQDGRNAEESDRPVDSEESEETVLVTPSTSRATGQSGQITTPWPKEEEKCRHGV